jgi:cytidylate kinase
MKPIVIAIDGPSGAGKGTVSRTVSHVLGFRHVDTGAMYRAVGWKALHEGVRSTTSRGGGGRRTRRTGRRRRLRLDRRHDVTHAIRTPEMDKTAASVARLPEGARRAGSASERCLGKQGGVVMEGRDIGTVVFPGRAAQDLSRRIETERLAAGKRLGAYGSQAGEAAVAAAIQARDQSDKTRAASPLTLAQDAVLIDTDRHAYRRGRAARFGPRARSARPSLASSLALRRFRWAGLGLRPAPRCDSAAKSVPFPAASR